MPDAKGKIRMPFVKSLFDSSSLSLLLSNLVVILLAVLQDWDLLSVMWLYWAQSVVIGLFYFLRMLNLKEFSTEGLKMNGQPVEPTRATQRQVAFFFLLHYGFFHFFYAVFLSGFSVLELFGSGFGLADIIYIILAAVLFFMNHLYSFKHNLAEDARHKPNIGSMMFFPYLRIIPMHMTIIGGGILAGEEGWAWIPLVFFMALKTVADVLMHAVEHRPRPFDDNHNENVDTYDDPAGGSCA